MIQIAWLGFAAAGMLAVAGAADVEPASGNTPLRFEEVADLAAARSPRLRADRGQIAVARAQVAEASVLPNPQVSMGEDFPAFGPTRNAVPAKFAGLTWEPLSLLPRAARREAAEQSVRRTDLDVQWSAFQVGTEARRQFRRVRSLRAEVALARTLESALSEKRVALETAFGEGDATALEAAAARAAADQARVDRLGLEADLAQTELALRAALGEPPGPPLMIDNATTGLGALLRRPPDPGRLWEAARSARSDLRALEHERESRPANSVPWE